MTDKEQIIVDGVDVSKCKWFVYQDYTDIENDGLKSVCYSKDCKSGSCFNNTNCCYKQLARKTQECENLKAEEKYLKQCCQKAGEELAKHSFEYDGKEKNLVVQAMELNEKYEKLKKSLEEIEKLCIEYTHEFTDGVTVHYFSLDEILDIINKTKGETNAK